MIQGIRGPAALFALTLLLAAPAAGQTTDEDLRRQIDALVKGQQEMRQQLEEIKKLLQARPAAPAPAPAPTVNVKGVQLSLGANPIRGSDLAKLTLIEFSDYQ